MSAETIQAIAALSAAAPTQVDALPLPAASEASGQVAGNAFGQLVSDGLQSVNKNLLSSQTDLQRLALGDAQNLHQIMIRMEETRMSFQLLLQVRNRLLEAYQDVMKMQI